MRIIRFFSSTLVFIFFLIIVGFFFSREVLLIMANNDLKRATSFLNSQNHLANCRDGFSISPSAWSQIRFEDEKNYVLETVCSSFSKKPVLLERKQLPAFVKKTAGASGFIFSREANPSQITLNSFAKEMVIYSEVNQLTAGQAPRLSYVPGPASECKAFNYQCCQDDIEQGIGERQSLATDCPKSCYPTCRPRPLIVSFNAVPISLNDRRTVNIRSGQSVTFAYVVSDGKQELFADQIMVDSNDNSLFKLRSRIEFVIDFISNMGGENIRQAQLPITNTIDFGDGQVYNTKNLQGAIDHVYTCNETVCYFEAKIEAQDARLSTSADNELSRLKIIVNN